MLPATGVTQSIEKEKRDVVTDQNNDAVATTGSKPESSPRVRGVTLATLIQERILEPGQGVLTIDYLSQKYIADLLETGKILWKGMQFASPSAWAIHVKKQVNPSKKSGCGWNSVKYRGKKLDIFKSKYSKKNKVPQPPGQSPKLSPDNENGQFYQNNSMLRNVKQPIKFANLNNFIGEVNQDTLVECVNFDEASGKRQPFHVKISSNCLLLLNFHCHLTSGEVVGYLGGTWDQENLVLNIVQAFPCKCRLGDHENAAVSEEQIRLGMQSRGLSKVGWYHSHPYAPAEPTLRDISCQTQYQMKLSSNNNPVLALICSPSSDTLDNQNTESTVNAFWVAPPDATMSSNGYYGAPMRFSYNVIQDGTITQDVHQELTWLVDYYKLSAELIDLSKHWKGNMTFVDRIRLSISSTMPRDRNIGYIMQLLQKLTTTPSQQ